MAMNTMVPTRERQVFGDGAVAGPAARDLHITTRFVGQNELAKPGAGATVARYTWAVARIGMGFIFLWAFLDKMFGLGFATPAAKAWIDGGNPTKGFLSGAQGPFAGFYHGLAGTGFANWAFMLGLAGIGVALLAGIGMRIAAAGGALLMTMMYTVVLPPATNPVIDDHLILAVLLIGLAAAGAGRALGLGRWWEGTSLVKRLPWLK
jgi:thiosulfate dehydrogenase [quinone] large subunit